MGNKERIYKVIFEAIDELNNSMSAEKINKNLETCLYGQKGVLDSLGLVNLIVAVEEKVMQEFRAPITIASQKAMSMEHSPFRSVASLADYVNLLLGDKARGN